MGHSATRLEVWWFGFLMATILGAAIPAMGQDSGSIVYRIDPEVSSIEYCNPGWKRDCEIIGQDSGRFTMTFTEGDDFVEVVFEDIDTASSVAGLDDFLPDYAVTMVTAPWLSSDDWLINGEQTPGCDTVYGVVPGDLLGVSIDVQDPRDCPCCPDAPGTIHSLVADAEPVLIAPRRPMAGEAFQAEVNWFLHWAPVSGVETGVSVEGDLIRIDGDVTVGIDGDWISSFYSTTVDLPPLPAGTYRVEYWSRPVGPGLPDPPYEFQGNVTLQVQAPAIPSDGPVSRIALILAIAMAAVLVMHHGFIERL